MTVEWAGRWWDPQELPPTAAGHVARLASSDPADYMPSCVAVLESAGLDTAAVVDVVADMDGEPDVLDLVGAVLEVGTARPWRSTVGLCRTTVTQWSTIRGRLIDKGIPDPLRSLPSLTALLDVVEVMLLDSMEKQEDRERFLRDLYRRDTSTAGPPPGWEDGAELDGLF
ncbi:hypothetical protein B842_03310 [Corynebacterium humireducens NBRC 106098 = DSM 45392]|uniref:Uncharacterized protein n=1 Tax=Corynebacterium humireducens NBRC 106098 = DSM 45392 TaxID=1223515 RepID=A0A0B5D122_9CORY|nr:hypothetical protein B842_03310 [Corynebacterium humireducens NBRC 106098 = DSM 45392]